MKKIEAMDMHDEKGLMMECSWCRAVGRASGDCLVSPQEIAGFDEMLGKPVCKKCIDAAFKIEKLLIEMQGGSLYVQAV